MLEQINSHLARTACGRFVAIMKKTREPPNATHDDRSTLASGVGACVTFPQPGHLNFRPANSSFTRSFLPHAQEKSIDMEEPRICWTKPRWTQTEDIDSRPVPALPNINGAATRRHEWLRSGRPATRTAF